MKKQKLKNYLKFGILLLAIPLLFFACVKDDAILGTESSQKPTFNITIKPYSHFKSQNKKLALKIDKLVKNESLQRSETSQEYGFTINDNNVQVMHRDDFTTYTFLVFRDNPEPNILENYVYKEAIDGTYEQFVLKYAYSIDENDNRIYDTTFLEIQTINDGNLLLNRVGCVPEFVEVLDSLVCSTSTTCTGGAGHNSPTDPNCSCVDDPSCDVAGTASCEASYTYIYQGCGGGATDDNSDNTNNDTNTTGGNTTGNNDNDNTDETTEEEIPALPFDDISERGVQRECRKVTDFLNDPGNAAFKQKLLDYANPTNYAENLDVEIEKSITAHENETGIQERQGVDEDDASVDISYTATHPNKTTAWAHLHPNDTEGTYSVFSFDDLIGISKILTNNKLDTGTFVAFLITKKGDSLTYYAMTINRESKFKDFFYYYNDTNFDVFTATQEEKDKRTEAFNKSEELRKKYYDKTPPLISSSNVNSQQMLIEFLKFMQEANMGTTLFKTDENFSDFTRVTYNTSSITNIKEQTCND